MPYDYLVPGFDSADDEYGGGVSQAPAPMPKRAMLTPDDYWRKKAAGMQLNSMPAMVSQPDLVGGNRAPSIPPLQSDIAPPPEQSSRPSPDRMSMAGRFQEEVAPLMPKPASGFLRFLRSMPGLPGRIGNAVGSDIPQREAYEQKRRQFMDTAALQKQDDDFADKRLQRSLTEQQIASMGEYRRQAAADRDEDRERRYAADGWTPVGAGELEEPVSPGQMPRFEYASVGGSQRKRLTPFGKQEQEQKAKQDTYEALPEAVTSALGMPAGLKVPPNRADAFYRLYETHQNNKGKTPEAQVAERTKTADMVGLKGRDRQVYIATGNIERPAASAIVNLSPEALNLASDVYEKTGQMIPGLGRSGANSAAVLNNSAKRGASGSDVVAAGASNKADVGSLKGLQKQRDQVLAFEETASRNLDIADQMSKKVDRSGSPLANKYILWTKGQVSGDTDTALLENAVMTAANEYAKIVSGQTGGATTDAARHEGQAMLRSAMAKGTFSEVVKQMKREMGNRRAGFDKQLDEIKGRVSGGAKQESSSGMPQMPKALTRDEALQYLQRAGGDKAKARELARADGRSF